MTHRFFPFQYANNQSLACNAKQFHLLVQASIATLRVYLGVVDPC